MKSFEKTNRDIRKATNGAVEFKIYGGGVMGDEGAMVRKMRTGQLDGAAPELRRMRWWHETLPSQVDQGQLR